MASSNAKTVEEYLASVPADRRAEIAPVVAMVRARLPPGYEEGMQFGMPCWYVPLARYPDTYNKSALGLAGVAAQKNYNALYLMTVYADPEMDRWFRNAYKASGKKLDMGKSCVRFQRAADLPLELVGEVIAKVGVDEYVERVKAVMGSARKTRAAAKKKPAKKAVAAKKKPAKKATKKARR